MIGSLKGAVLLKTEKFVIIETAGVGYKVNVSSDVLSKLGQINSEAHLWIHTHLREDSLELYGFMNQEELKFFEMLLGVSGIGPRSAIAILGVATIDTLKRAIGSGDTAYLTKISGIGKKTAEKILIELRDKMDEDSLGESMQGELDALEALKSLGYSQSEARDALKKVSGEVNTNQKIKEALRILGK